MDVFSISCFVIAKATGDLENAANVSAVHWGKLL